MSTDQPLVSIGMSVRNCAATLGAALRSILAQSHPHWELLLIDDGSSDRTLDVALGFKDPRIMVMSDGTNVGLARRLNQTLQLSRGKYFARMDGDDICYPHRIEHQVAFLDAHPEVDLSGTGAMVFGSSGAPLGTFPARQDHAQICIRPWAGFYLPHPTWMGRLDWFRRYYYRESALRAQDQDLLLRSYRDSHFAALPEILLGYRQERLSLRNILRGRYYFYQSLVRQILLGADWRLTQGLIEHPLKALVEILVILTGMEPRFLRHRTQSVGKEARDAWISVWEQFQDVRER